MTSPFSEPITRFDVQPTLHINSETRQLWLRNDSAPYHLILGWYRLTGHYVITLHYDDEAGVDWIGQCWFENLDWEFEINTEEGLPADAPQFLQDYFHDDWARCVELDMEDWQTFLRHPVTAQLAPHEDSASEQGDDLSWLPY